jgi:hypothetical protein
MQGGRLVCYYFEIFHVEFINYPIYDKELYALLQVVSKWKHYIMSKETIIHIYHQPLQYLQAHSKLQQTKHYMWMGFLQKNYLVIKYKKGRKNKLVDMLHDHPHLILHLWEL